MNKNIYLAGAAVAVACLTAGLVIIIARPADPNPVAQPHHSLTAGTASSSSAHSSLAPANTSSAPPPATTTTDRPRRSRAAVPALSAAQQTNAMLVAQSVIATIYSIDTALDSDPTDGARRAAYLMTPAYAAILTAPPTTGNGVRWQQWAAADAYVTVTGKKINIPWTVADNRFTVIRNVGYIQTVHTAARAAALQQQTLAVTLVRAADGQAWRVQSMETP